jgi:RNA polymerase sigma factor (sigma-70 family)
MSDYRVTVKVRNARMLRAIERLGYTPSGFAAAHGFSPTIVCALVAMKIRPTLRNGDWRREVIALCEAANCTPQDLFTERQMDRLERNTVEREVDEAALIALTGHTATSEDAALISDARRLLESAISGLNERYAYVVRERAAGADLGEVGAELGVSKERIRQMEAKAHRKLREWLSRHHESFAGLKWEAAQ